MPREKVVCLSCLEKKLRTRHHVFPRRHRWPSRLAHVTVELCESCHFMKGGVEYHINRYERQWGGRMPKEAYVLILLAYIFT